MRINFARTTLPLSNYDKSAIFVNGYLPISFFFFFFTNFGKCDIISSFFFRCNTDSSNEKINDQSRNNFFKQNLILIFLIYIWENCLNV